MIIRVIMSKLVDYYPMFWLIQRVGSQSIKLFLDLKGIAGMEVIVIETLKRTVREIQSSQNAINELWISPLHQFGSRFWSRCSQQNKIDTGIRLTWFVLYMFQFYWLWTGRCSVSAATATASWAWAISQPKASRRPSRCPSVSRRSWSPLVATTRWRWPTKESSTVGGPTW